MARRPFYGSGPGTPIAKMDMQTATAPGRFYANALQNFGTAISNSIEKYRAKKEKKEQQETTYTALKRMGLPDEVAKAGSKDPNVISTHLQKEKIAMQGRAITARNKASATEMKAQRDASQKEGHFTRCTIQRVKTVRHLWKESSLSCLSFFLKVLKRKVCIRSTMTNLCSSISRTAQM